MTGLLGPDRTGPARGAGSAAAVGSPQKLPEMPVRGNRRRNGVGVGTDPRNRKIVNRISEKQKGEAGRRPQKLYTMLHEHAGIQLG